MDTEEIVKRLIDASNSPFSDREIVKKWVILEFDKAYNQGKQDGYRELEKDFSNWLKTNKLSIKGS